MHNFLLIRQYISCQSNRGGATCVPGAACDVSLESVSVNNVAASVFEHSEFASSNV